MYQASEKAASNAGRLRPNSWTSPRSVMGSERGRRPDQQRPSRQWARLAHSKHRGSFQLLQFTIAINTQLCDRGGAGICWTRPRDEPRDCQRQRQRRGRKGITPISTLTDVVTDVVTVTAQSQHSHSTATAQSQHSHSTVTAKSLIGMRIASTSHSTVTAQPQHCHSTVTAQSQRSHESACGLQAPVTAQSQRSHESACGFQAPTRM